VEDMSFSFSVKTISPLTISASLLAQEAESVLSRLLNQKHGTGLNLKLFEVDSNQDAIELLTPRDDIVGFSVDAFAGDGGCILYGMNIYWRDFGDSPFYEFSVLEIHRSRSDPKVAVALALAIAAANIFLVDIVSDGGAGVISMNEDGNATKEDLFKLSVVEVMPVADALQILYRNMNL
jgi:hypothetical protein